jgi:hypothetical protein
MFNLIAPALLTDTVTFKFLAKLRQKNQLGLGDEPGVNFTR